MPNTFKLNREREREEDTEGEGRKDEVNGGWNERFVAKKSRRNAGEFRAGSRGLSKISISLVQARDHGGNA